MSREKIKTFYIHCKRAITIKIITVGTLGKRIAHKSHTILEHMVTQYYVIN